MEESCSSQTSTDVPVALRSRQNRRLAIHESAVRLLREQPALAEKVRGVLDRWSAMGVHDPVHLDAWRRVLNAEDWNALLEPGPHGDELRKGSPFPFLVDQEERLAILRRFAARKD